MGVTPYTIEESTGIPVIINADDFGYSPEINSCIVDGIHRSCVSSATLMVNAPAFEEAVLLVPHLSQASIGIHLNLTEFHALRPSQAMRSLGITDEDGCFRGNELRRLRPSPQVMEACYDELNEQLQTIHQKGLRPSHLDSHHHIHTIPWLLPVIYSLQRKFKIYKLRTTMNVYSPDPGDQASKKLLAAKRIWQAAAKSMGFKMTQRLSSLQIFMDNSIRPEFSSAKSIELMCHPGQLGFESESEQLFSLGPKVLPANYQLVNYNQYPG